MLLAKICNDGLFIAYVNSSPDTLLAYPFGISCILLVSAGNRLYPLTATSVRPAIEIQLGATTNQYIYICTYIRRYLYIYHWTGLRSNV